MLLSLVMQLVNVYSARIYIYKVNKPVNFNMKLKVLESVISVSLILLCKSELHIKNLQVNPYVKVNSVETINGKSVTQMFSKKTKFVIFNPVLKLNKFYFR